ncbi:hypothetical protein [Nocardia mexicana]|uniref:hypothetical protein n=1 Tax=Nocardia mexicana TaxID=279262 RepID=UPI0011C05E96|nr:hypothetical protein [Nocardia mexicana]
MPRPALVLPGPRLVRALTVMPMPPESRSVPGTLPMCPQTRAVPAWAPTVILILLMPPESRPVLVRPGPRLVWVLRVLIPRVTQISQGSPRVRWVLV